MGQYGSVKLPSPDGEQTIVGKVVVRRTREGGEVVDVQVREGASLGVVFAAFDKSVRSRAEGSSAASAGAGDDSALVTELSGLTGLAAAAEPSALTSNFDTRLEVTRKALVVTRAASGCPGEHVVAAGDVLVRIGGTTAEDLCRTAAQHAGGPLAALRKGLLRAIRAGTMQTTTASSGERVRAVTYRFERFPGDALALPTAAWDATPPAAAGAAARGPEGAGADAGSEAAVNEDGRREVPRLLLDRVRAGLISTGGRPRQGASNGGAAGYRPGEERSVRGGGGASNGGAAPAGGR